MGEFLDTFKSETSSMLRNKKNLMNLLILGILVLFIPLAANLVRQQQILQSRANVEAVTFTGPNVETKNGKLVALKSQVSIQFTSPLGPPAGGGVQSAQSESSIMSVLPKGLVKPAYAVDCGGSLSFTCGTYPNHRLSASWNVTDEGGGCNIYIQDSTGDHYIDNKCNSSWSDTKVANTDVTDDGHYKLFVSNGGSCLNQQKGDVSLNCTPIPTTCTLTSWSLSNINPAANTDITATITGKADRDWSNVKWRMDGGSWKWNSNDTVKSVGPPPVFEIKVNSGAAGTHKLEFSAGNETRLCDLSKTFITGSGGGSSSGDTSGSGTSCNGGNSYQGNESRYATWNGQCDVKLQKGGSGGIGQNCCELACGASAACDEQGAEGVCSACGGDTVGSSSPNNAKFVSQTCPPNKMAAGQTVPVDITLKNTGTTKWTIADKYRLGSKSPENNGYWGKGRVDFDGATTVTPGDTYIFNFQATAPATPGTYSFQWQMLKENAEWFGESTQLCQVQVTPATAAPTPTPTPAPPLVTTHYRFAENPTDLANEEWKDYTVAVASTPLVYTFKDQAPGVKTIFAQFKDSTGKVTSPSDCPKCQASIKLLGSDPAMTSCLLGFEGNNAVLNLTGQNFGADKGTIKSGDKDLQIKSWKNDSIQAVFSNAPTGENLPVSFTNTDGQTGIGQCSAISQLALGAKVFCRAPSSHDTDNVDLILAGAFEGGTKAKEKVRIDKNGIIQGLVQKMEAGKTYFLSLKAPKSLRKTALLIAGGGITNIPNFVLPVGDIFPTDGGDGIINALDKSELNRQWIVSQDAAGRTADFNKDGRVNSVDWACMRYDFGKSDDAEPVPGKPAILPCGGISNIKCPSGYDCKLDGSYPDASGRCLPAASPKPGASASPGVSPSPSASPAS